jgi:hypothetical protein
LTQETSLILDGSTTLELKTASVESEIIKEVHEDLDDGNIVKIVDSNRSKRVWAITAILTNSELETLIPKIRSQTTADYPKLRVYDKSTTPFYNDYKVYFGSTTRITIISVGKWKVALELRERT